MSKLSSFLNKSSVGKAVKNVFRAPDRIIHHALKGDFKTSASVAVNPFAGQQATRDRTLRRFSGAAAGAVGGFVTGGPIGAVIGGGIGGYRASQGHGQLKDAAGSFGFGLLAGGASKFVISKGASLFKSGGSLFSKGGLSGVEAAGAEAGSAVTLGVKGGTASTWLSRIGTGFSIAGKAAPLVNGVLGGGPIQGPDEFETPYPYHMTHADVQRNFDEQRRRFLAQEGTTGAGDLGLVPVGLAVLLLSGGLN